MYNPYAIRRCVRRQYQTPDGLIAFKTRSFTKRRGVYHPAVDLRTGEVWCDCPDFRYRCQRFRPSIAAGEAQCKHLRRALRRLGRLHMLQGAAQPSLQFDEPPSSQA